MVSAITLAIDGQEIVTQAGKTILQAAMEAGLYIPYLCYYPGMKPFGACRMCVVEVENGRGTPASCTTPVADGMVVSTNTPQLQDLRKGITELVISEHPHGCLTCHRTDIHGANLCGPEDICLRHVSVTDRCVACPKNERCELKDTTIFVGTGLTTPLTYKYRNLPVLTQDPFYDLDYNLCIVCGRCVRACEELRGDSAITFTDRSGISLVGPAHGTSLLESGSEFCGSCIDVCPVGALVESDYKWEKAVENVSTTCPHCPVGCQLKLDVNQRGKVIRAIPELEADANHGQACFKGKFGLDFINSRNRLTTPLVRRNGSLEEASWEEALSLVAEKLSGYRGDQFAAIGSYRGTNEENYLLQKFARVVMGTNNVDHSSNIKPEMLEPLGEALGYQAATNPIWDLEDAKCILTIGTNTSEEHNVAAVPVKRAVKKGAKLIVIDSREVELTRYATTWIRPKPGTDAMLLGGMLRVIVDEVLEDEDFLKDRCENLDALKHSLWRFDINKIEDITGVSQDDIRLAARTFAENSPAAILYALDTVPQSQRVDCVNALVDLALITGNVGKPNAGLYPLRPGTNDQGSWDVGCVPNLLPGYQAIDDVSARAAMQQVWGVDLPSGRGVGINDVFQSVSAGNVKAMLVVGDSPSFSNGDLGDIIETAQSLEFLVVQDTFLTGLAQVADVVLPSVTFAEKEGTFTNLERRVQPLRKVLDIQRTESRPDWWIICEIAKAMNGQGFDYHCPAQILDEISSLIPFYAGITYQRLLSKKGLLVPLLMPNFPLPSQLHPSTGGQNAGIQWPCTTPEDEGNSVLYAEGFPSGKARFIPLEMGEAPTMTTADFPFLFLPGRVLHQSQQEMEIVVAGQKNHIQRDELLKLHPLDAADMGINEEDWVEVISHSERIRAKARLTEEAFRGTVSATFLFGDLMTRLESSEDPDPMSRVPRLPLTPVRLAKLEA
ncbi:MAG: molybdopterin-dependent oxidoreductase [Chloroflexi bacterium]|nr:molybdopterin-dependent oxidoreductase [Chloroflexota bacterium]